MRAVGAARWFLSSASIVALAVFAPERALAACTFNGPGQGIVALGGSPPDSCSAAAGAYNGLPAAHPPQGVGFYAAANGSITATAGLITITTPNSGVEANGGLISLNNIETSVSTTGVSAYGIFADSGGQITLGAPPPPPPAPPPPPSLVRVQTGGSGAFGLYATGAGSTITAYATVIVQTSGASADGVVAEADGRVDLTNGVQVTTSGSSAYGAWANTGGQVTLNGGSVTTSGAGATGLYATGVGSTNPSTIIATGVAVTTGYTTNNAAIGVLASGGGTVSLAGASVMTSGVNSPGIQATGGDGKTGGESSVTTAVLAGNPPTPTTIATIGDTSPGVQADSGGQVSLSGGSVMTSGTGATGLYATGVDGTTGAKSTITATGVAVTTGYTTNNSAVGVLASAGGAVSLTGGSVTTYGNGSPGLQASGSNSSINLVGTNTFTTKGDGAIGLYATLGGAITATGPVTITTGVPSGTGAGAFGVNADGAGSQINLASATVTTFGAGATGLFASDAASSGAAGSITVSGTLNLQTKNAAAAAIALQGNGASIFATGGGSINAAGDAIDFLGGKNQVATFDNFTIANVTGNLIFADPSVSTVNFNNTTANAGLNNLLDATNGSMITLNASASALTGAIQTDSASTSIVNLMSGSVWNMTNSSAVSNLAVANSAIVFAPPGSGVGFKTLTVGNYVGTGANLTMNAALGGSASSVGPARHQGR